MTSKHGLRLLVFPLVALFAASACEATTVAPSDLRSPAECAVEVLFDEGDPTGLASGSGFPPNEPATLTIVGPPDPGSPLVLTQADDAGLRTDIRGVVLYRTFPGRENIGTALMTLSAGGCTASTDVVLDASMFPPACSEEPPPAAGARAAAYEGLILADEPIGYWRFEEQVDNPLALSEVGLPGAVLGNPVFGRAGVAGSRAIGLRGDGRVAIDPIDLTGAFTIEGWLLLCDDDINEGDGLFAAKDGAPNVNFFDAAPRLWTGDEDLVFAIGGFATHLRWYHVAVVRADGEVMLVVDGISLGSAPFPDRIDVAWLGDSGGGSTSGQLDEFAVYDHALTLEDLADRVAAAR